MNFCEKNTGKIFTELELKGRGLPVDNLFIMRRSGFYPIEYDYISYDKMTQKQEPIEPLEFDEDKQIYHQYFQAVSLNKKELEQNLDFLQKVSTNYINETTSRSILAGFEAIVEDKILHFSYDDRDQTNFISKQLQIITNTLPEKKISWKGYEVLSEDNLEQLDYIEDKGKLVPLSLTPEEFTSLYKESTDTKSSKLAVGEERKIAIANATSIEEIRSLFKSYGINENELLARNS